MTKSTGQADKLRGRIDLLTKLMANPNRSASQAKQLELKRQKLYGALKILEKGKK